LIPLLELLRSLGFGALFGAGNAGLAYTVFPHLFEGAASLQDLLIVGGLIGGGHRAVDTYIIGAVHSAGRHAPTTSASTATVGRLRNPVGTLTIVEYQEVSLTSERRNPF